MTHDVSLSYARSEHMSPAAMALAGLLHALVALALFYISPLRPVEHFENAINITMDAPVTPPAEEPKLEQEAMAAAPRTAPAAQPPIRLGLPPPAPTTTDPRGAVGVETPAAQRPVENPTPDPPSQEATKQAEPEPPPPQQQALAPPTPQPPPPPPPPALEQALPPIDMPPPPPVTERDVPKPAPAPRQAPPPPQQAQRPPPPPPQRPQQHQPQPPPQQQQGLRPSPLGQAPQQPRTPAERQAAAQPQNPTFHNPADNYGSKRAAEDYLWQVMRRIAQFPYVPKNTSTIREEGTVLTRVTIARDGRLVNVVLERSSGLASLDTGVIETIRKASPYAPLPADIEGASHTFLLPVSFRYNEVR
ncbi:MAG: energy transducer TonB [Reyranella sp.]|nr:MAG: energy transducer TonB [Reyranella sp.]